MIKSDVIIGKNTQIFHPDLVNLYGCTIGDNCKIGAFVEIKKNVSIGNNVKIEPFVFIPEGITIANNVFVGPHVCFTNDRYPKATTSTGEIKTEADWKLEKTIVEEGVSIGANCTILCGITIGHHAMIGAGSVVTKNVPPGVTVIGNPAKQIKP